MRKRFFIKNLMLFLLPILIPILVLATLSITLTQRNIREEIDKNNANMLRQVMENTELILGELDTLSLSFDNNPVITNTLKDYMNGTNLSEGTLRNFSIIRNFIDSPAGSKPYIHSIYTYYANENGIFFTSDDGFANLKTTYDSSWYESFMKQKKNVFTWTESRAFKRYRFESAPTKVISIYRRLYSYGSGNGLIVLNIKPEYFNQYFDSLGINSNQAIAVTDDQGSILFSSSSNEKESLPFGNLIQEIASSPKQTPTHSGYAVSKMVSKRYGWIYISVIPQADLYKVPVNLIRYTLFLAVVSFLLALLLTYYLTKKNYNRIMSIVGIIDAAEKGSTLPPMPSRVKDEYGYILSNILKTFIEQSYLKVQLSEKKFKMQTMELLALQSQINPHFLYNTLETINWKIISLTGKPNEVNRMVENLSDILKYSLSKPDEMITVEEEVTYVKSYIDIQKVRYKDKFHVVWEVSGEAEYCLIPKMLLQPLIENSIYHGIKEKSGKSGIKIKIHQSGTTLKIAVIDNGLGIEAEKLGKIREKLQLGDEITGHIGLINTHKRLKLVFGEQYGLKIKSRQGTGTVVMIEIPSNS